MLKNIVWHDMRDTPPVNTPLLIIDESEAFGEGYYFEFEGSALRAIRFWFNEPEGKKAGDTVLWAELPSRDEIKSLIYNRKESA